MNFFGKIYQSLLSRTKMNSQQIENIKRKLGIANVQPKRFTIEGISFLDKSDWSQIKAELEAYFAKFTRSGKISCHAKFYDIPTIYLNFSGEIDVQSLMTRIHFINGHKLRINFMCLDAEKRTRTIMINTHDKTVQADTPYISKYFSRYGRVLSNIPFGKNTSQSFLKFEEYESAEKALDEGPHIIGSLAISVSRAKNY